MDSLCHVRNKIMYVLSWRTVSVPTRVLFWYLFPSLLRNSGNKHQNNPLLSAETIRHSSTYITIYISGVDNTLAATIIIHIIICINYTFIIKKNILQKSIQFFMIQVYPWMNCFDSANLVWHKTLPTRYQWIFSNLSIKDELLTS